MRKNEFLFVGSICTADKTIFENLGRNYPHKNHDTVFLEHTRVPAFCEFFPSCGL